MADFLSTFAAYLVVDRFHAIQSTNFTVCAEVHGALSQHVQLALVLNVCLP